jgi:hypothetical protein
MFGGMPTYLISSKYPGNFITKIQKIFYKIPRPASYLILNFGLFFLLLLIFNVNVWISFVGALAFGLNSAFFVWIDTGHMSKANAITYMALVVAGVIIAYRQKLLKGGVLAALGLSFMVNANHPQMTYYAGIMVAIIGITYLIYAIKNKTFPSYLKSSAVLIFAATLALGANFSRLYTTYEYSKYSIRGESELTFQDKDKTSGLDKSYILDYSYDLGEAITAFIPRFKGGGMAEPLGESSAFYKTLEKTQGKKRAAQIAQNSPLYWGTQPISGAPFYYGAVLCFLFVLGLFVVKGKEKWWVIATVAVAFLLSLGKNIPFLANFMVDYFPAYNKFRDVKNIIVIQQFAMALLGVLAIKEISTHSLDNKTFINHLKWAFGITGGLALIFAILPGLAGDFVGHSDVQLAQSGWPRNLIDALQSDRKTILRADAFRSFIFVTLAAAGLWAFWTKKIKAQYAIVLWAVLIFADMWPINKRYLNNEDFVSKRKSEAPFTPSKANLAILQDKTPDYRVLNMAVSPFNDASTSYFHKSIGGYHGAKMQRYQEMIEQHISPEIQKIGTRLQKIKTQEEADSIFIGLNTINMLNTKYIIYNPEAAPLLNKSSMGNAWFVRESILVKNADEEIAMVDKINLKNSALIDQRFQEFVPKQLQYDENASIILSSYAPNKLVYSTTTQSEQLAVFSEIYYPKGWIATIDEIETPHFRANYLLRSMVIPAGKHEVVFQFEPQSYKIGNKISFASSFILLLAIVGLIFIEIRKCKSIINDEE